MTAITFDGAAYVPRQAAATGSSSHLRLTARGRRVLGTLAAAVVAGSVLWGGSAVADGGTPAVDVAPYTVVAGETWWSIASSIAAPGQDVRDVVRELVQLNGVSAASLQSGQQVLLPVRG